MHEWILKIGYAIYDFFVARSASLLTALEIAGTGMIGIFVVIGVVVLSVLLLNKVFSK